MSLEQLPLAHIRWLPVRNDSGEEIPAFSAVKPTSSEYGNDGQLVFVVGKPDADSDPSVMISNGVPIPIDGYGLATYDVPVRATVSGAISFGAECGTLVGEWPLAFGQTGFTYLDNGAVIRASTAAQSIFIGKTTEAIGVGTAGEVQVYEDKNNAVDPEAFRECENLFADVEVDKWVAAFSYKGVYYLVAAQCDPPA